jgi:hypothetical protein
MFAGLVAARRRTAVIAVTAVFGVGVGVGVAPAPGLAAGGQCHSVETAPGGWTTAPLPATPSAPAVGSSQIVSSSVVGQDPAVLVATDGISVFRTADGGCNWQTVFTLGPSDYYSAGGLAAGYSITNIANGQGPATTDKQDVYLAISPNPLNVFSMVTLFGVAPPELLAASHDGGRTFAIVSPQPNIANPIVPECLTGPSLFFVPPTDGKTIYMQCSGGLAQTIAEQALAGGAAMAFRSTDGGVSWAVVGLPHGPVFTTDAHWLVPGVRKNELWLGGFWAPPTGSTEFHLAVWRSRDAGTTWTRSIADPTAATSAQTVNSVGVAVDRTPGAGSGRVAVYNARGTFVTSDDGQHWQRLRNVTFSDGVRPPVGEFFLRHRLYALFASTIGCKGDPVFVQYPTVTARPITVTFPSKWGTYSSWATDSTFAVVGGGAVASGIGRFCSAVSANNTKLLSLRVR